MSFPRSRISRISRISRFSRFGRFGRFGRWTLGAALLLYGCDSDDAPPPVAPQPSLPSPGQYFDAVGGNWLSVAENNKVNVACRARIELPHTYEGPCAGSDYRSDSFNAIYLGTFVTPDSAAGYVCGSALLAPDLKATGYFTAKWDGFAWHVETEACASDGCRTSEPSKASFVACR